MKLVKLTRDDALDEIRRRKWTMHYFGPGRDNLNLIAAVFRWRGHEYADVLILRSDDDATAYRAVVGPNDDPLKPNSIVYFYQAEAMWTLRAILSIAPPGHRAAPNDRMAPKAACFIPAELERPHTIRPPLVATVATSALYSGSAV